MEQTQICVASSNGRWRVTESGPRNSIACFGERQDAMEYAKDLAGRTRDSSLVVRSDEREPEQEIDLPRSARVAPRRLTARP
jgi:Uncharacterized protein conserved in bacteria (DUF2188)